MKSKGTFTYKEVSLIIGIVVAILITITLWIIPSRDNSESKNNSDITQSVLPIIQPFQVKFPLDAIKLP